MRELQTSESTVVAGGCLGHLLGTVTNLLSCGGTGTGSVTVGLGLAVGVGVSLGGTVTGGAGASTGTGLTIIL